jgi:hypothetical protein
MTARGPYRRTAAFVYMSVVWVRPEMVEARSSRRERAHSVSSDLARGWGCQRIIRRVKLQSAGQQVLRMRPARGYVQPMSHDFRLHRTPQDVLDYEIVQEQAAALGRMGRALEAALAKLREFDAAHPRAGAPPSTQKARRTLAMEAGHALWMFVVQREACGLRDSRLLMRDYDVPVEVQQLMGAVYSRPSAQGR